MFNVLVPRYYKIAAGVLELRMMWTMFVGISWVACARGWASNIVTGHRFMCPRIQILALS